MLSQKKNRDEKQGDHAKEHADVLELASHDDRPLGVGRVMNNRPEETSRAEREEKREGEKPGETKLFRIDESARAAKRQSNKRHDSEQHGQTGEATRFEIFAFRCWRVVDSLAHFLGASGLADGCGGPGLFSPGLFSPGLFSGGLPSGGLFSAGLSKSARCSGGTSAAVPF